MATSTRKPRTRRTRKPKQNQPQALQPEHPLLRTSERQTFNRCEWQWWQSYEKQLTPVREAPALRFGTLIHKALEKRYPPGIKRGPKPAETFEKLFAAEVKDVYDKWGFRDETGEWQEAGQLGVAMLENYVATYGRDEEWKVLQSEMTFRVPVYGRELRHGVVEHCMPDEEGAKFLFWYVGTMDGVWESRMDARILVNDYKTTSNDPEKEVQGKHVLDEQGTAYWTWGVDFLLAEGILSPQKRKRLAGMLYTMLYKAAPDERPVNAQGQSLNLPTKKEKEEFGDDYPGSVSKKQPTPRFHRELVYREAERGDKARKRAVRQYMRMALIREGALQPYKSVGTGFPDQQCKACPFFDMCELDELGADYKDLAASTMTQWDPYDAHEIAEEGKAH